MDDLIFQFIYNITHLKFRFKLIYLYAYYDVLVSPHYSVNLLLVDFLFETRTCHYLYDMLFPYITTLRVTL